MTISGIVVACRPGDIETLCDEMSLLGWAEVHHRDPVGRLVVTIEARDEDESMERLTLVQRLPRVLSAQLGQYHNEPSDS